MLAYQRLARLTASRLLRRWPLKWGWNEPERVNVQSGEVKVDAALVEQLRAVYAELGAARPKHALCALEATTAPR